MLYKENLQSRPSASLRKQEVNVLAHCLHIFIPLTTLDLSFVFFLRCREVRSANLVKHKQSRYGSVNHLKQSLECERQRDVNR